MNYQQITEIELPALLEQNREELAHYEFVDINLTEYNLKSALFIDCKFTGCNLSNMSLVNTVLRGVQFERCNVMGINWTEARAGGDYHFSNCKLDYGVFQSMDLRGMKFENCSIREAEFSGANLSKASFQYSLLSGTRFANVNLEKADLRHAKNYFLDPKFSKLKEAKFSFPEALILLEAMGVIVEM